MQIIAQKGGEKDLAKVFKRLNRHGWWLDFLNPNGKRVMKKAKSPYKGGAEVELGRILDSIGKGTYQEKIENIPTFEEASKEYMKWSRVNKMPSSSERDEICLKALLPVFGKRQLRDITTKMIEDYKTERVKIRNPKTVNHELSLVRHLYNKAILWDYAKENPVKGVKFFRETLPPPRFLSQEEIEKLLDACTTIAQKDARCKYIKTIVLTALHTGLRKSNILNLTWDQVDLKARRITVPTTKNHDPHTVPVDDALFEELKNLPTRFKGGYVFSDDGTVKGDVRKSFASVLKLAGIENFRFHDLRHTFASYLAMSGNNLRTVQDLLGHKSITMTLRYAHLSEEHLAEAVSKMSEKMKPNCDQDLDSQKQIV